MFIKIIPNFMVCLLPPKYIQLKFVEQLRNEKKFVEPSEHDLSLKLYYAQRSQYLTELFHKVSFIENSKKITN